MNNNRLTIFAFLKHYQIGDRYFSYEPYVRELIYWSEIFEKITLYTEVRKDNPVFSISELPPNIIVESLYFRSGGGLKNNLIRILQLPILFFQITLAYRKSELIHTRSSGFPTMIVNLLNIIFNKHTIEKWATNAPPDKKLGVLTSINFRLLLLSRSNTRVFAYTEVKSKNFLLAFPALFSVKEMEIFKSYIPKNKWQKPVRKFVCVARLHEDKNLDIVFESVRLGKWENRLTPGFELHIIGDGPLYEEYDDFINKNGLEGVIFLKGKMTYYDTVKFVSKCNFLIMPGVNEGWPKVINEALIVDTVPIVVSQGNAKIIMDRLDSPGLLFNHNSESLLSTIKLAESLSIKEIIEILNIGHRRNESLTLEKYKELIVNTFHDIQGHKVLSEQ